MKVRDKKITVSELMKYVITGIFIFIIAVIFFVLFILPIYQNIVVLNNGTRADAEVIGVSNQRRDMSASSDTAYRIKFEFMNDKKEKISGETGRDVSIKDLEKLGYVSIIDNTHFTVNENQIIKIKYLGKRAIEVEYVPPLIGFVTGQLGIYFFAILGIVLIVFGSKQFRKYRSIDTNINKDTLE